MVFERYRSWVAPYLDWFVRPFLGWRPDRLSWLSLGLSLVAAALAASAHWTTPAVFLGVGVLVFLGGSFDVLDGEVARRTGRASPRGDFLDHALDRYADLAILLGIAASGFAYPLLALLALVSLLLTSYMGTQAQAVGAGRAYGGLLTRADRLLILSGATFLLGAFALPFPWGPRWPILWLQIGGFPFTVLDIALVWFVIAGQWTALARARSVYRSLPVPPP